jgi:Cdc6-like AAA superfamily ATPase
MDYSSSLTIMLETIHSKNNALLPLVFVLDNLEGFCNQDRQIILYNLFDAVQATKMTLVVVGMTSYIDVVELFEKRGMFRKLHLSVASNISNLLVSRVIS